ncbi:Uncharacterised protein [Candidatus Gugararchaeum adminiculabundum]|nr:Uncharacterised protein [Candidatus Gugararchaeum adminiculabundum]
MVSMDSESAKREDAAKEAAKLVLANPSLDLEDLKKRLCEKYRIADALKSSEILAKIPEGERTVAVMKALRLRPVRTISGVTPIAIMSYSDCPHGRCTYCPRGEYAAQSYTGREPAALRAIQNKFDSGKQALSRMDHLEAIGHKVEKCELIVMGGTFNSQPKDYQENFMKGAFDAFNGFESASLREAIDANEKAKRRVVGVTFETRPDWCKEKHIDEILEMGGTRVEMGVQVLNDAIYEKVHRGHSVQDVVDETRILKDASLKVLYHMMPGLYQNEKEDVAMFRQLFSDERFRPDMLKIYPTLVIPGTQLYEEWKKGEFRTYSSEEAAAVIAEASEYIPKYVRVMRMQRDIPVQLIAGGMRKSNLRQLVDAEMKKKGVKCKCIRCRESGLSRLKNLGEVDEKRVKMERISYDASGGREEFLSFEDEANELLLGFVRLRIPGEVGKNRPHRKEIDSKTALIRELHVYGQEVAVGKEADNELQVQHKGYGLKLLREAERIAKEEFDKKKMIVISGVGAREYYYKFGYKLEGPYVSKFL